MHNTSIETRSAERVFFEAIALKRLISAVYNGVELILAPHQLFLRHGALHVSALNTGRAWRSDEERKLGQFKLDGLSDVAIVDGSFEPLPHFAGEPPREGDEPIFAVAGD